MPIAHRHKLLFMSAGAVGLVLLGALIAALLLLSGAYSTAATKQHFSVTYRMLELGLRYSVSSYAEDISVPDMRAVNAQVGLACYREHCVQCHGAPGIARDPLGRGQLPLPSSLSQSAREWPEAHLFYVTQKGVRMSGMPAWEFRISEEGLWSTVAFLKAMPFMTASRYEHMSEASAGISCPAPVNTQPYSAERARTMLRQHACDSCHVIGGMVGPDTRVGPSLEHWSSRKYIAGVLPNTPENLVRWIVDPQGVSPQTLMPDLDVSESYARDMARYLLDINDE